MMHTDFDLRQLQLLELEALIAVADLCAKNNITFFLRGGSVMGAVKYKGFIPWDDDMDIAVPRQDYERLIEVSQQQSWSDKFSIISYRYNPSMHCYFPRVLLNEDERLKLQLPRNNLLGLVLIDILPLDGSPNNKLLREIYFAKIYLLRALAGVWTLDIHETVDMHETGKKGVLRILKFLQIHRLYKQVDIYHQLEKLYSKYDWKHSKFSGTITGSLYRKEILPTEYWGNGILADFEGKQFRIPARFDDYLKQLYGENYRTTLPPENKRKSHIKMSK